MYTKKEFTAELDLKFLPQADFESIDGLSFVAQRPIIIRNLLRLLMHGWKPDWQKFCTREVLYALFVQRDPELLKELRFAFQQGFFHIFKQLKGRKLNEVQHEQAQLYLSNCLSFLPFSDLTPYESIIFPQYLKNQWILVEYHVEPIELTSSKGWKRFFTRDHDRVFAYGLKSFFQEADSHLICMGTTYPAGQGFLTQIAADIKGFETPGKFLIEEPQIYSWLEQQVGVHICGVSLGGIIGLLLAIDKRAKNILRVDALNPPGLHDAWFKSQFDHWDDLTKKPQVVVQKQFRDPISSFFGVWKKDWKIINITPPADKQGPNSFWASLWAHALNYAGWKGTEFDYINPEDDNAARKAINFWFYSLGRSFLYYSFILPYMYVWRPMGYLLAETGQFLIFLVSISMLANLVFGGAISSYLLADLIISAVVILWEALTQVSKNLSTEKGIIDYAKLHDPKLPRNKTMDIYHHENSINMELTYKEVNTYYQMIRCLKKKEFLPAANTTSKHVSGINKKELLQASQLTANTDVTISFRATKAKAVHIKHSLMLIHKLGKENQKQLNRELEKCYAQYQFGKHK